MNAIQNLPTQPARKIINPPVTTGKIPNYAKMFLKDLIMSPSQGLTHLVEKRPNKGMRPIRSDYPCFVMDKHTVDGRLYEPWPKSIELYNRTKSEIFYTPNTFFGNREEAKLCSLRAFYIDIDCHDPQNFNRSAVNYLIGYLLHCTHHGGLPEPIIVFTGRGLHLIWIIEPVSAKLLPYWKAVQEELINFYGSALEDSEVAGIWDVDHRVCDCARLLRFPGSYNAEANRRSKIVHYNGTANKLSAFVDFFDVGRQYRDFCVTNILADNCAGLLRVAELRNWNMTGYRSNFLNIYASGLALNGNSLDMILESLRGVNNNFTQPLPDSQVRSTAKCAYSHKYNYSALRISDDLNLSSRERQIVGTPRYKFTPGQNSIFSYMAAASSGVDTRVSGRSRIRDSIVKKKKKVEKYCRMPAMRAKGMSAKAIASELGISLRTVRTYWGMSKEEIVAHFFPDGMPDTTRDIYNAVSDKYKVLTPFKVKSNAGELSLNAYLDHEFFPDLHHEYKAVPKAILLSESLRKRISSFPTLVLNIPLAELIRKSTALALAGLRSVITLPTIFGSTSIMGYAQPFFFEDAIPASFSPLQLYIRSGLNLSTSVYQLFQRAGPSPLRPYFGIPRSQPLFPQCLGIPIKYRICIVP